MQLDPDALRREIDDTLAELDRLEADVVRLFDDLLGPDAAHRVAAYMRAKERDPETAVLREATPATPPAPSTAPPATP